MSRVWTSLNVVWRWISAACENAVTHCLSLPSSASIDLQLPKVEGGAACAPAEMPPEPKPKFRERIITSLGDEGGPAAFRKNKTQNGKSRSLRARDEDDDWHKHVRTLTAELDFYTKTKNLSRNFWVCHFDLWSDQNKIFGGWKIGLKKRLNAKHFLI